MQSDSQLSQRVARVMRRHPRHAEQFDAVPGRRRRGREGRAGRVTVSRVRQHRGRWPRVREQTARAIKSAEEVKAFRASLATCEESVRSLHEFAVPGVTESEAFGHLVGESIARGGEYPETRLLTAGPRTNPWFQEASDRAMQAGELLSFDTDLIGPMGFYNDLSRSWVIGGRRPTRTQATLLDLAREQIAHNIDLLRPGVSFVEFASRAFRLPDAYLANRYADLVHGCGLGVEYPFVLYPEDADDGMYDGRFEAEVIVCVASYVGAQGGPEGVKLEEPVLITENGPEVLTALPLDAADF